MNKQDFFKKLSKNQPDAFKKYNYDLLAETFLATDKVLIKCIEHGVFEQNVGAHVFGSGCPSCWLARKANSIAHSTESFIQKSKAKHGDKFNYSKTNYVRLNIPLILTCDVHGDIELTPLEHEWSKYGCRKCSFEIPRETSKSKVLEKANKKHNGKYDYSRVVFVNVSDKVEIICHKHGSFWQDLYGHSVKGNGCPKCAIELDRISQEEFIARSQAIHGNIYDYSKAQYITGDSMITIACPKHGDFIQKAKSHLAGCRCRKCCDEDSRSTTEEFIRKARLIHKNTYDYSKVIYHGNKVPVEIICSKHGSFWQKPNTHTSAKSGCALCFESKGEKAVEEFLIKYGISFIREYPIKPYRYRYDFFLPDFNIYIEFHGAQHYRPVDFFGGMPGYLTSMARDAMKKILVEENNGCLIEIPFNYLTDNSVEKELIIKLKKAYKYWFVIDSKLQVFKTAVEVYRYFDIPLSVLVINLLTEVKTKCKNLKVLF